MSLVHWLVVLLVIIVVFGSRRLPSVMNDLAEGLKAFKKGMKDEDAPAKKVEDNKFPNPDVSKVKDADEV